MDSDTLTQTAVGEQQLDPGMEPDADVTTPTRGRTSRAQRSASQLRAHRSLLAAILVCAVVPSAVVATLWQNLTEPFWFNEQWRAYYISDSGNWWGALKSDGAPFPAGWFFLERISGTLFGSTELVLRIPTALFLPGGCVLLLLLARRWMSTWAAVVVALVGAMTGTLVGFALQLSEYQVDAAAVVAIVLLHEIAGDVVQPTWRSTRLILAYAGIAVACIFSTPAVFIAGPLLLLDVLRSIRRPRSPRIACAVASGLIIAAQLVVFVLPQSALRSSPFWDPQFLPHHGFGNQATFVWDGIRGFVSGPFTSSPQWDLSGLVISPGWDWTLTLAFGVLLLIGVAEVARSPLGRYLLFAIVASQVMTLIASYERYWPFGFVRTNYYLIPLLMLLAGIGGVSIARAGISLFRRPNEREHGWVRTFGARIVCIALCVLVVLSVGLAVTSEVGAYRQTRGSITAAPYGSNIGAVVATVRTRARPGAAVVVTGGVMADPGWRYYGYEYSGKATQIGRQIPVSRVAFPSRHGSRAITEMVNRLSPPQLFLYFPFGTTAVEVGRDIRAIARGAYCGETDSRNFGDSGLLIEFGCLHG